MCSQVFGNLIAAYVLKYFNQSEFYLIMAAISSTSIIIFATLPKPVLQARIPAKQSAIETAFQVESG